MKRIIAVMIALTLVVSLAACGNKSPEPTIAPDPSVEPTVEPSVEPTVEPSAEPASSPAPTAAPEPDGDPLSDCTALLTAVWDDHDDDDKFPAAGGDYSNSVMGAPASFELDATNLDAILGLPSSSVELIDNAASLMHMMNANTFTCGAYHVSDSENVADVAQSLRDNIQARQWMCGFPDRVVVISVGNYVISLFGNEDLVNTFVDHVAAVLSSASVLYNEAIA